MAVKSAQDAMDRFEIARQYASHIQAVTEDRHLESFFEASWGMVRIKNDKQSSSFQPSVFKSMMLVCQHMLEASDPFSTDSALLFVHTETLLHLRSFL